jgi:hypothetical protein
MTDSPLQPHHRGDQRRGGLSFFISTYKKEHYRPCRRGRGCYNIARCTKSGFADIQLLKKYSKERQAQSIFTQAKPRVSLPFRCVLSSNIANLTASHSLFAAEDMIIKAERRSQTWHTTIMCISIPTPAVTVVGPRQDGAHNPRSVAAVDCHHQQQQA